MRHLRGIAALAAALAGPGAALAQEPAAGSPLAQSAPPIARPMVIDAPGPADGGALPVMTIDQAALYSRSIWGLLAQGALEQRRLEIEAENDRLAEQFAAEERSLTALRQTLPADEFRKRADEFDKRVVEVRQERDAAANELIARDSAEQQAFFRAALPVLATLMRERGAMVVLDQRAIFVAAQSIDVTEALIERIDREIGAGPLDETPPPTGEAAPPPAD